MFSIFKKAPATEAEEKLAQITELLFPQLELHTDEQGRKYHVDSSTDANLEAALVDLEMGNNDKVTQNTIRKASDKLFEVRKLLEAYNELSTEAQYYVVDDKSIPIEEVVRSPDDV